MPASDYHTDAEDPKAQGTKKQNKNISIKREKDNLKKKKKAGVITAWLQCIEMCAGLKKNVNSVPKLNCTETGGRKENRELEHRIVAHK